MFSIIHIVHAVSVFKNAVDLLKKANGLCLVSRALGVTLTFEPLIAVGKRVPVG